MAGNVLKQVAITVAVASLGIAALTGCATPKPSVMTTKAAGVYYLATVCKLNAAEDVFNVAVEAAEQTTSSTGPALDELKAAALGYETANRAAAVRFEHPKLAWPVSVRKSILVLRGETLGQVPPLKVMATATQMSDEVAAYRDLPSATKAAAAVKDIRSTLGLPSTGSSACGAPKSTPPANSVAPATGVLITSDAGAYTFHAPVGWTIPKNAPQADAYAIGAKPDAKGFYDTISVLPAPATSDTLDEVEQAGVSYLKRVSKATHIQIRPRIMVDGDESVHLSSLQTQDGVAHWADQYQVNQGGIAFTINFDSHENESQAVRDALAASVLASWTWT